MKKKIAKMSQNRQKNQKKKISKNQIQSDNFLKIN